MKPQTDNVAEAPFQISNGIFIAVMLIVEEGKIEILPIPNWQPNKQSQLTTIIEMVGT